MKKKNVVIIILLVLFNPLSLYLLYGSSKILTGVITDSLSSKKEVHLEKCNRKNMSCNSNKKKETVSVCEYINTKNCACYECIDNFNFDDCSQCYMPATTESFCVNNECKIPNFP
jgi:hypothetical protein